MFFNFNSFSHSNEKVGGEDFSMELDSVIVPRYRRCSANADLLDSWFLKS